MYFVAPACSSNTAGLPLGDGGTVDGGVEAGNDGPKMTVTTRAAFSAGGALTNATLVAVAGADGVFQVVAPAGAGTYAIPIQPKWTLAVVCAASDSEPSRVSLFERTDATKTLEVMLEPVCSGGEVQLASTLTGNLANVPASTSWMDFAYPLDSRGAVVAVTGTTANYELVNVANGTWDLTFGVRDESFGPLTRVGIRRAATIDADKTVDFDMATTAPLGTRKLDVHGIATGEATTFAVNFVTQGPLGIDFGPHLVPDKPDVSLVYSTLADTRPTDRYQGELLAESDAGRIARALLFSIHDPIDVDVTLPPALDKAPAVKAVGATPGVRLEMTLDPVPDAMSYQLSATVKLSERVRRTWSVSLEGGATAPMVSTMPDLTALPGWKSHFDLPGGNVITVGAEVHERKTPFGDGTLERVRQRAGTFTP